MCAIAQEFIVVDANRGSRRGKATVPGNFSYYVKLD